MFKEKITHAAKRIQEREIGTFFSNLECIVCHRLIFCKISCILDDVDAVGIDIFDE